MGRMLGYPGLHHTQRMLRKMGRRGLRSPPDLWPVLSQAGWEQGDGPLREAKQPQDTQRAPVPTPVSPWGSLGASPGLGREGVQCRVCGCLIVPSKHQHGPDGWGDTCSAGAPSAGHGRVANRRNAAEEQLRLPGAAVHAPPGCFPPRQEVAR